MSVVTDNLRKKVINCLALIVSRISITKDIEKCRMFMRLYEKQQLACFESDDTLYLFHANKKVYVMAPYYTVIYFPSSLAFIPEEHICDAEGVQMLKKHYLRTIQDCKTFLEQGQSIKFKNPFKRTVQILEYFEGRKKYKLPNVERLIQHIILCCNTESICMKTGFSIDCTILPIRKRMRYNE